MKRISLDKLVANVLAPLSARQRDVIEGRFGLKSAPEMTLAEIGARYGVTRERIRQIERAALQTITGNLDRAGCRWFADLVVRRLEKAGGVRRQDALENDLKTAVADGGPAKSFGSRVKFLLDISSRVRYRGADDAYHSFWRLDDAAFRAAEASVNRLTQALTAGADWKAELRAPFARNYVSLSKKFAVNSYGDFGLAEWPHINPKTARDWAFLVLKKTQKPLHFTQLAKAINGLRVNKPANTQTVHNELIKDNRFMLVGRGVYGLKEFNIMPGTCREVIGQILKKNGPQSAKNVVKLVNAERLFKENTLLINLQNKKHFVRLEDGRYAVREA